MEYKPCYFEEEINKIINQLDINQEDKKKLLLDINKDNIYIENIKALIKKIVLQEKVDNQKNE